MHSAKAEMAMRSAATRVLLIVVGIACATPLYADPPDAVIELWEQHWMLNADGSTVYHEKQHVRLNSDRAYHEFADPRITYNVDTDELELIVARVKMADGTYREPKEYSHVGLTDRSAAGWPAFANVKQHLIVMAGIEPGCVVELEYKIESKPGAKPYLAADVRLDHRYPVRKHTLTVSTPPGVTVGWHARRAKGSDMPGTLESFTVENLPGMPSEPQALPWQARCTRLAFSTVGSPEAWLNRRLAQIDTAAVESDLVKRLADEWTKDETDVSDKLRALQEKLSATFNFVNFNVAWRPADLRAAADVLDSSYGLPAEAAAVLLALARSVGVAAQPAILVNDDVWTDKAPQDALVAAYVVVTGGPNGLEIWDPHHGRIQRDTRWAGHTLLSNVGGEMQQTALPAWTNPDESRCELRGKIAVADDGKYSGSLTLRTSGLFVPPEIRRSTDRQRNRAEALLRRVLHQAKIDKFTVTSLSADRFEVELDVKLDEALEKLSDAYRLSLAQDGPFAADVSLPLTYSRRETPARLTGAFDEQIELTIEWPEAWNADAIPSSVAAVQGDWGIVEQEVETAGRGLTLTRHTRITQRDLPPDAVLALREPLNELRSAHARTVLLRP
jgi:hypothetical protein